MEPIFKTTSYVETIQFSRWRWMMGLLLMGVLLLSSCECSVKTSGGTTNHVVRNLNAVLASDQTIRNHIQFEQTGGLKVETAFMMLESGELISESNQIKAGDRIKVVLKIAGWQPTDGVVPVGVGQELTNSDHRVMYHNDDMFATSNGFSPEDAQYITMIMELLNKETIYNYYQVDFKVWNKKADQHIYGNYRFTVKKD